MHKTNTDSRKDWPQLIKQTGLDDLGIVAALKYQGIHYTERSVKNLREGVTSDPGYYIGAAIIELSERQPKSLQTAIEERTR